MHVTDFEYVKRYRMLFDFSNRELKPSVLPSEFFWIPWRSELVDVHARLQHEGFRDELDSLVFPTFTRLDSCIRLLRQITSDANFVPEATWLIGHRKETGTIEYCATVQGMKQDIATGNILNVAVLAPWRQRGLGHAIVCKALAGFHQSGCDRVFLDVTAENSAAVTLYSRIGFAVQKTTFKETCFSNPFF